jgi:hypothetical protein
LGELSGQSLLPFQLNVSIPPFDLYRSSNFSANVAAADSFLLDLAKSIQLTKSKEPIYETIAHKLEHTMYESAYLYPSSDFFFQWSTSLPWLTGLLALIDLIWPALLSWRLRQLTVMITALNALPKGHAFRIPTALMFKTSTLTPTYTKDTGSVLSTYLYTSLQEIIKLQHLSWIFTQIHYE